MMSLNVQEIPALIFCGDIMPDGAVVLGSNVDGKIYKSVDEETFVEIFNFGDPNTTWVHMLLCDSRGKIFARFASTNYVDNPYYFDSQLYRINGDGTDAELVLDTGVAGAGPAYPLMTEGPDGTLYVGIRGMTMEPGQMNSDIYRSRKNGDPGSWELIYSDPNYVRHPHGLAVDPVTRWLYFMAGECYSQPDYDGKQYLSYIARSKDQGDNWTRISKFGKVPNDVPPFGSKPPMGGPCFYRGTKKERVIYFGSDCYECPNSLWRVRDLGDEGDDINYSIEKVADVHGPFGEDPIVMWLHSAPGDAHILAGVGFMIWMSESGNLDTWTRYIPREMLGLERGSCFMCSHKWSHNANLYVGGGQESLPGLKISLRAH